MLQFIFDWFIKPPADVVADFAVVVLGTVAPILAGGASGYFAAKFLRPYAQFPRWKHWTAILTGLIVGIYVAVVCATAFYRLPQAIDRILKDD